MNGAVISPLVFPDHLLRPMSHPLVGSRIYFLSQSYPFSYEESDQRTLFHHLLKEGQRGIPDRIRTTKWDEVVPTCREQAGAVILSCLSLAL